MGKTKLTNTLTLVEDDSNGFSITSSKTGLSYELLEGKPVKGRTTSDIVFIMVSAPEIGYLTLLNYCGGAECQRDELDYIAKDIENFENGNGDYRSLDYNICTPLTVFDDCVEDSPLTDEQVKIIRKIVYNK